MSMIDTKTNESVWKLYQFLGLNENPDGDTKLKLGEASACRNWKITRDRNLKKRPGFHSIVSLGSGSDKAVRGLWFGNVNGEEIGLAAADGKLWKIYADENYLETPIELGTLLTTEMVNFFPYSNIVYILNGHEYYSYDGSQFKTVEGYRPLIIVARDPTGTDGSLLEAVNKLNGKRRVWFSPDGTAKTFQLPETGLASIDYVMDTATGENIPTSSYSKNITNGTVTFNTAPARGISTLEIGYTFPTNNRGDVTGMTCAELYLGAQDNAVFLYGNGTNKAIYSGLEYDGTSSAEYFPDLNVVTVADDNTPITDMIRHNSALMCYKTTSAYRITFGMISTTLNDNEFGFYVVPVNKSIGNVALGQTRLVNNAPITLHGESLYRWENTSPYSAEISRDERMAIRMSDRVYGTLGTFDLEHCYCYDDNDGQEYYVWYGDAGLVYNYAADAWYRYTAPDTVCSMCNIHSDLIFGFDDGSVRVLSENYFNDDGEVFECYWESGSIDFGKPYQRKFMSRLWIGIKPQATSKVTVTISTDKKSEYTERLVINSLFTLAAVDFGDFSFKINRKPQIKKLKIKAKKFAFMKFILKNSEPDCSATILMIDPLVRETGYVK